MPTIAEIATGNADLNILVAALGFIDSELGTDLVGTVGDANQDLTVFAPTDAAFGQLAADLGFAGDTSDESAVTTFLTGLGAELLRDVVNYHISAGSQTAADIANSGTVTTLNGTITAELPRLIDNEPDLLDPSVIAANVQADNGIVHLIDRVLLPLDLDGNDAATITGIVAASGDLDTNGADFDILLQAVTAANLADTLNDANANFTVFAPTDAAFTGLATLLGYSGDATDEAAVLNYILESLSLLSGGGSPIPLLDTVLKYHVAANDLTSSQVIDAGSVDVLNGTLTLDGTSLVDADPDLPNAGLQTLDIQAANGIVHVIDGVLIPADVLQSDGSNGVSFEIGTAAAETRSLGNDNDYFDGNGGNDVVFAGAGNDVILGGDGFDAIVGKRGADMLAGGLKADTIDGGNGFDVIKGGNGADVLHGGRGNDLLQGNRGDDEIRGNRDEDTLIGGQGNDTLTGGHEADTFVFGSNAGSDTITDYEVGLDVIDLANAGFASDAAALAAFSQDGDDAVLDLGSGNVLRLLDVQATSLTTDDIAL